MELMECYEDKNARIEDAKHAALLSMVAKIGVGTAENEPRKDAEK